METGLDREITAWIGVLGAAGAQHVMRRFGMRRSWAYKRLGGLVDDGLLAERRLLYRRPGLYVATAEGLRWAGLERLGVHNVGPGGFGHMIEIAAAAAELHIQCRGAELLSERTIRARENETGELFASIKVGELAAGRPALHRPDLALVSEERTVALELELSVKAPRRLATICRGYARARHIDHAYYLAAPPAAAALDRAIQQVRAADRITVLALHDIDGIAAAEKEVATHG